MTCPRWGVRPKWTSTAVNMNRFPSVFSSFPLVLASFQPLEASPSVNREVQAQLRPVQQLGNRHITQILLRICRPQVNRRVSTLTARITVMLDSCRYLLSSLDSPKRQ